MESVPLGVEVRGVVDLADDNYHGDHRDGQIKQGVAQDGGQDVVDHAHRRRRQQQKCGASHLAGRSLASLGKGSVNQEPGQSK